ncbi:MAG: sensor histidine kinase [Bryobacteraceae bacterium]
MKRTIARRTRQAYFLVLLVPFLLGVLVLWFAEYYRSSIGWVTHTQQVLAQVDQLLLVIAEAESSQRAFVLTGEEHFAGDLESAEARIMNQVSELRTLVGDNLAQQRRMDELDPVVARRMDALHQLVNLRRVAQNPVLPNATPLVRQGALLMTTIRALVAGLKREEQRLLEARLKNQGMAEFQLAVSFVAGLLINIALLFRAYKLLIRYGLERDAAEAEFLTLNEELEGRVAERTSELQSTNEQLKRSNDDLSRFAHVASHDLQEPLRTVASYAGLLERRYGSKLDGDADLYLRMIVGGAKRMQGQVQDLLRYSRTDAQKLRYDTFNLAALIDEVRDDLATAIGEKNADIRFGVLPRVRADRTKMRQVLENLITNALKFSNPGVPPSIAIEAETREQEWLISVADNGIGFETEFTERIFIIFQRLHSFGTYPGTGIGLAICKRIIESHGGRIWASSEPGVGSTFSFTIPKRNGEIVGRAANTRNIAEKVD